MNNIKDLYIKRADSFNKRLNEIKRKQLVLSILRLIDFIAILVSVFYLPRFSVLLCIITSVLIFTVFLLMVKKFSFYNYRINHLEKLIQINKNEIDALNFDYEAFEDGAEFIDHDHPYSFDLDIFGAGSMFQYLNRTSTFHGKMKLSGWLSKVNTNADEVIHKQNVIKELASRVELRQNFQATGQIFTETRSDYEDVIGWLSEKDIINHKKVYYFLSYFFPILTLISVGLTIVDFDRFPVLIMVFLFQLLFVGLHLRKTNRLHSLIGKKLGLLKKIFRLLAYIENEDFHSENLISIQDQLKSGQSDAHTIIEKISKIVTAFDNRLNLIAGVMLNGLMIWDIQCILRIEAWKKRFKELIPVWFNIIGEFDAYSSLANFSFNHPDYCFAEPVDDTVVSLTEAEHPLIPDNERVCNNFEISKKGDIVIITGANMAGKSTFLRTVVLNLVLASHGAPVCASKLKFRPMNLFTSMRTSDSLKKNESYFYAELKRLKEIIDLLKSDNEIFIALDEILKGTNSADKQKGSKEILRQFIMLDGSGLIATHDLDLAGLEQEYPDKLINKCFEIEIEGTEIFFDYKLYDGITRKMNATLLMQQMGIVPE